ncbi:retrovirus-related pol polyprotein from transposon TNT 1-94 [Tanacetum coccineum]
MDDLIRDRNAKLADFQQEINTLKETLSNNVKEKESLSKILTVFKTESKEKESKYIDKEIVLEKQNKELENIIKVFAITTLKNELRKLKGKNVVNTVVSKPNATIAPGMFKLDIEPISPRLKNNRDAHEVYIKKTIEYTDTLRGFVESARTQNPSEPLLEYACMFTKHVQELLVYVSQTCPSSPKPSGKLVAVTPINKDKRVRFAKPVTSSNNIPKQTDSLKTKDSNKPLITRPPRSNQKNKVKDHSRKVNSGLNKTNSVSKPISNALVKNSVRNAKFESICAIYNKCLFDANHDMCLIDFVNDVNVRLKSKSKRNKMRKAWKPTGKVFTNVGYKWKPTGRFFTIVGNSCPLTRITPKKIVHLKETTFKSVETPKPEIKVYSRRPKQIKLVGSSKKAKIVDLKLLTSQNPLIFRDPMLQMFHLLLLLSMIGCLDHPLVSGLQMFKTYDREPLSAHELPCALGKSKKSSHQPKAKDTNQEKLYLLHMDLCGPMRVESINGKKYILVIVDDYSQFTWVKFLRSKDEAPDAIIKCIKNIQVRLNATVRNVRIDNGTEFVNQTLRDFYENVSISHQTSIARTP